MDPISGKRELVVEDNPLLAFNIDDALRERGALVTGPALDLDTGMLLVRQDALDGAVLDINIGGRPVWSLAPALQSYGVPFVFVSGDCRNGLPDGFSNAVCLDKPAETDAIRTSVSTVMAPR